MEQRSILLHAVCLEIKTSSAQLGGRGGGEINSSL